MPTVWPPTQITKQRKYIHRFHEPQWVNQQFFICFLTDEKCLDDKHNTSGQRQTYPTPQQRTSRLTHGALAAEGAPQALHGASWLQFGFLQRVGVGLRRVRAAGYSVRTRLWQSRAKIKRFLPELLIGLMTNRFDDQASTHRTCSEREQWYLLDMCFLMVSLTDLTFLPREIRDSEGDLTSPLKPLSPSFV